MPDHKEMGREPTERERETVFAPHHSPKQQPDGDPGVVRPRIDHGDADENSEVETDGEDTAGERGKWRS